MKKRSIFTLLLFCSLLISQAALSPAFALAQQNEQLNKRPAQLGQKRGALLGGSEIWTYESKAGDVLRLKIQANDPVAQCDEGTQLAVGGRPDEALPLLEAGFAARESVTFADPNDEGYCALILGQLRSNFGNPSGALEAYQVARDVFQTTGNRQFEGTAINSIGMTYSSQGKYELALEQYSLALAIRRELGDASGEGATLNNIATLYRAQGKYQLALELFQRLLTIMRELGNRASEAIALNNIGNTYDNLGQYDKALEHYQQALEIRHEVGDRDGEGRTLNNIGRIYQNRGQYDRALEHYNQALEISREVGNRSAEGDTLNNIGLIYSNQGQYEVALKTFEQALIIKQELEESVSEANTLNNIGQIYDNQGKYDQALELYEQALEVFRVVGNPASEGTALNNMAAVYRNQGKYDEALELSQQALEISRKILDRAGEGTILGNIGGIYEDQGKYDQALESHQLALEINREVGNRAGEGDALNNIAIVYGRQGKYDQALQIHHRALELRREVGDRAGEGATLNGMGTIYDKRGEYEQALETYQEVLDIRREIGDRAGESTTLNGIGLVYDNLGEYESALQHYSEALSIQRQIGNLADEGITLNNIGAVYYAQRRYELALEHYNQALSILREVGDELTQGITLSNIGFMYEKQGQTEEALHYYEEAMDTFETVRATAGDYQARASFIAEYTDVYYSAVGLYYQQGQNEQAFLTSERGRARSFLDSLATGQVQLSDDDLQALIDREREVYAQRFAVRDQLARVRAQNTPDAELIAQLEAQLEAVEKAYDEVQADIEARGGELAALVPGRSSVPTLAEVQALLDEQTTLISYSVLEEEETLAFILTSDELNVVPLGVGSQDLREQITTFYLSFTDPFFDQTDPHSSKELQQLYQWLITPLKPHLHTRGVAIAPHNILHYFPFAALTDGETYLSDEYALFTLPAASALPLVQQNHKPDTTIESVLALGNPTFDSNLTQQEGLTLANLPFAKQEVERIADLFGDQVEALFGTDATESIFRKEAGRANIVHVAAYGVYNSNDPLSSMLVLADDATNDGLLEVREVYDLKLTNTTLVVLTAPETDLRSIVRGQEAVVTAGDEVISLNRAFLFAGAPSVLSSLWGVDDEATAALMERFYTHLRNGTGKAEALRQAQIDVREEYPHPYYWAGFVLTGLPGEYIQTPVWPWVFGWGSILGLFFGFTALSYSSGLPPLLLLRQKSNLLTVARNYRPYYKRWQDASPITRLMVLLAPLSEEVESRQLLEQFVKLNAPIESDQLENELNVAVREGWLQHVDGRYRLAEPHLARALQAHEGIRGCAALAKQIRDTHPLCINGHRFLEKAGFTTLTLIEEPLLYCCDSLAVNWRELLPASVYVRFLPGEILDGEQVRSIRRKVMDIDPEASVVFAMTDERLTDDGWAQIATLEMERFTVLPIESTLINEGLAAGNEQARLRTEIEKRRGGEYDPYKVTTPVTGAFSFFGRDRMIKSLLDRLASGQPVGVFGLRKLGKSSLLHALQERAPFPVAFVNLETIERGQSIANLYQRIVDDWARWMPVRFALKWEPPTIASDAPTDSFVRIIRELLDFLEKAHQPTRVGVFLDEIELIVPRPAHQGSDLSRYLSLLRPLRGLVDEGVPLSLVVAGLNPALNRFDDWQGERNPAYSLFEEINLSPLANEDGIRMIRSIGAQIGLVYSDESLQLISELSGGHPFLARQLCSLLYKQRQQDKRQRIEVPEVAYAAQRFIYDDSTASRLRAIWQDLGNEELWGVASAKENHVLLLDLARAGHPVRENDLLDHANANARRVVLINLERYHIIHQPQTGRYAIRFGLLKNWLRRRKLGLTRTSDHESRG